ncbi:MAG: hypothetical protein O7B30_05450 [Thaumarchaeota archaeon]|nr:hypothetical protein [Nitrososphaerota archaeon]
MSDFHQFLIKFDEVMEESRRVIDQDIKKMGNMVNSLRDDNLKPLWNSEVANLETHRKLMELMLEAYHHIDKDMQEIKNKLNLGV